MRKNLSLLLLSTSCLSFSTFATDNLTKKLDAQIELCQKKAENTLATVECNNQGQLAWDKRLNKEYQLLLAGQSDEFKAKLKASQLAWIKYRDSYLQAMQSFYHQQDGTIWNIVMSDAALRVTRDKAIELYTLRTSTDLTGGGG